MERDGMNLVAQCDRSDPHLSHEWLWASDMYHCKGVEEPITVYTFDERNWPEFTVEARPNADVRLYCSDCQWCKDFTGPARWSVLTTATVRHGMSHQEEQR